MLNVKSSTLVIKFLVYGWLVFFQVVKNLRDSSLSNSRQLVFHFSRSKQGKADRVAYWKKTRGSLFGG